MHRHVLLLMLFFAVGMVSEKHVAGTEFGPLQLAIWKKQFAALRDGDRYFYVNDPDLQTISQTYGITYQHTLADLINLDAGTTCRRTSSRQTKAQPGSRLPPPRGGWKPASYA